MLLSTLSILFKIVSGFFILVSFYYYSLYFDKQFQTFFIRYSQETGWQFSATGNDYQTMFILPSSVVTQYLIVLNFRLQNKKQQQKVIFYDALATKDYRTLVVDLKVAWQSKENS